jgi:outer membrane protein
MNLKRLAPLPLALGAAFAVPAHAESLQELYDLARAQDATWQSARASYEAAIAKAEQNKAQILPQANLTASSTRTQFSLDTPSTDRRYTTNSATVSGIQPLYRPANWATYKQAEPQARVAEAQLSAASQDVIVRVSQAYFDVLAAQDTLTFVQAQKAAVAEQLASAKRNFEVGTATITDTREAQARYDLVLSQEIQAENDLRVKKLALDTIVGKQGTQPNPVAVPPQVPTPQPADPEQWVMQAEDASPAILGAKAQLQIAELEVDKAKAGHKPTLDLVASRNIIRNIGGSSTAALSNQPETTSVGVNFNLPLFAGFATQNRIRETLALDEKAKADLEAARRSTAQSVRTAYFGLVSGQNQVRALESAEASSQSALEANRLGYQVGVRINIDVLNAQSQLFQTKRDLAQARYSVLMGQLKLRQAVGTLQAEDLARLNALLAK